MYRAGRLAPGARLLTAANLVRPGLPVADIGTDHGKLAVYLALRGISPKVIATDIHPMPLAAAKALVHQSGCEALVDCRLGDGLAPLRPGEVGDVVIAGMGGETMVHILENAPWVRDESVHLVLVPASRPEDLRRWLVQNGFALQKEIPVEEHKRFYSVLSVGYTGKVEPEPSPLFCQVGLVPESQNAAARGYIAARLNRLEKRRAAPLDEAQRAALEQLICEVQACLP